jgi:flagellar biosynthesis protein FlhG
VKRENTALFDQAKELRRIVEERRQKNNPKIGNLRPIAVPSGTGGGGKSNLSVNFACALAEEGKNVVLLDADLGLANVDMLCGLTVKYNLSHLIEGSKSLDDVLVELRPGVWILPGGSGVRELTELNEAQVDGLLDILGRLEDRADILLIDTAAGIHKNVLEFAVAADTTILLTTPEPTSIRDAYSILKTLKTLSGSERGEVVSVVNMVNSEREALEVANRLSAAAGQFLDFPISYVGYILRDRFVEQAVRMRKPFYQLYPDSPAAKCVKNLVRAFGMSRGTPVGIPVSSKGAKSFFSRLIRSHFVERWP